MLIKLASAFTDLSLPTYKRDTVLLGDGGGIKFLFDLAYPYSYAGGVPANASPIININDVGGNGGVVLTSGQSLVFAGGGFDFTAITAANNYLEIPATVAADIWGAGAGLQYFMQVLYVKLPTSSDWNIDGLISPISQFSNTAYTTGAAELLMIDQQYTDEPSRRLGARRQTNGTTSSNVSLSVAAGAFGSFAQIAYWRNAAGIGLRLKTVGGGVQLVTGAVGAANVTDFGALTGKVGLAGTFSPGAQATQRKWKLYRGWVENLATSGRDPATVLDADWSRTVARGVFS
jgi:hypothetical protein